MAEKKAIAQCSAAAGSAAWSLPVRGTLLRAQACTRSLTPTRAMPPASSSAMLSASSRHQVGTCSASVVFPVTNWPKLRSANPLERAAMLGRSA